MNRTIKVEVLRSYPSDDGPECDIRIHQRTVSNLCTVDLDAATVSRAKVEALMDAYEIAATYQAREESDPHRVDKRAKTLEARAALLAEIFGKDGDNGKR